MPPFETTRRSWLTGAATCALTPPAHARARAFDSDDALKAVLQRAVAAQAVPWAGLLVARDGEDLFVHMEGAPRDHVDVLRSATKIATVTCLMTLVQAKALKLEDPVARFIPAFAGEKAGITLRHLLSMSSGLPPVYRGFNDSQPLAEAAQVIAGAPLAAKPGEVFIYGNLGLTVAGRIAEIAAGESWDAYFARAVAAPLGMTFEYGPLETGRLGGGGRTSLESYGRLLKLHLAGGRHGGKRILDYSLVKAMQSPSGARFRNPVPQTTAYGYGMGWWFDQVGTAGRPMIISDPGAWGAYPWIDLRRRYAAFLFVRKRLDDGVALQRTLRPLIEAGLDR
jgi:CubicO group peptidase (beta-lactamase class C family)